MQKRVLFLSASFFGYQYEIKRHMEAKGYLVDYFDERPSNSFSVKALIRINPKLIRKYIDDYHKKVIDQTAENTYDYVVIIKAEAISVKLLKYLRNTQPKAHFVLYLWDNFSNFIDGTEKINYFDKVYTFDKGDAARYGIKFRPLFYLPAYEKVGKSKDGQDIDILFIGTLHSDRYRFLEQIKNQVTALSKTYYYFLFFMSRLLYFKMKIDDPLFRSTKKKEVHFNPLNQQQIVDLFIRSKTIIDIQHPKQTGLTMRTIETLGADRKLITTNEQITLYDFYNPDNILVVDRYNPKITEEFINQPYRTIDPTIKKYYSLDCWIEDILNTDIVG